MSKATTRFFASIPAEFQKQGVACLVLDHDDQDTGGWFLYGHASFDTPSKFDGWYETREIAECEALRQWGVGKDAWSESPSLRR
jgi:hypothetical protein